jgi:hypothetical protein
MLTPTDQTTRRHDEYDSIVHIRGHENLKPTEMSVKRSPLTTL